jgi:carbonic anhydrase
MTQGLSIQTDLLLANARHYQARLFRPGAPREPRTGVAVLTCMDARINVYALLGLSEGDAHIVRNAGGVVTEDVIRSLTISQRLLNTTDVMIIMHAACGLREITDEQFTAEIEADVGLRPTWRAETFHDPTSEARHGVARLRSSPFLHHATGVRGFLFDETTGALREVR